MIYLNRAAPSLSKNNPYLVRLFHKSYRTRRISGQIQLTHYFWYVVTKSNYTTIMKFSDTFYFKLHILSNKIEMDKTHRKRDC